MLKNKTGIKILIFIFVFIAIFIFSGEFSVQEVYAWSCGVHICYNGPSSWNSGSCGTPCGALGGNPWTKYMFQWCSNRNRAKWFIVFGSVCSTADKCIAGEVGLRAGRCDCGYGGIYKYCCRNSDNAPVKCVNFWQQDPYWPPEGVCPSGSFVRLWSPCPYNPCTNECSWNGQTQYSCSTRNGIRWRIRRTCGYHDADPCLEWSSWSWIQNCGSDFCGSWGGNFCRNNDVYRQRTCYDRGCSGGACFSNSYTDRQKVQECGIFGCSGGACNPACTDECSWNGQIQHSCSGNWRIRRTCGYHDADPCLEWSSWSWIQNCGSDFCGSWGGNFCRNNDVYRQRTCYDRGCSGGACFSNASTQYQRVYDCGVLGCLGGACIVNQKPNQPSTDEDWNHCAWGITPLVVPGTAITFYWTYSDPEGDPQTLFEIQVDNSSAFIAPKFNHTLASDHTEYTLNLTDDGPPINWSTELTWATNYWWRVRVRDSYKWSEWSSPNHFRTDNHASPEPSFTFAPFPIVADEEITFTDTSTFYDGGVGIRKWEWDFDGNGIIDSTGVTATHTFADIGGYTVILTVTDGSGYFCKASTPINAVSPLLEWIEVPPIIWFRGFLARVTNVF